MKHSQQSMAQRAAIDGLATNHRAQSPGLVEATIGRLTAMGAMWIFLANSTGRVIAFATNIVLVRLLSPDDFGLVSFSMVLISAFVALQELGVPEAIVYGNRDIRQIGGTALTINIAASLTLLLVVMIAAPWYARFSDHENVAPIASVLAIGLVASSLGSVQNALLVKELAFKRKFLPDVLPLIVSSLLSVLLAVLGFGVWSLVIAYVARSSAMTIILWSLSPIRPWPRFDWSDAKELMGYGRHVSLAALLGFVGMNADYFVVGMQLGSAQLGIYWVAFMTASLPIIILGQMLSMATFPAYASVRGDAFELIRLFRSVFQTVISISIPIALLMFFGAPAYVSIVLGDEWSDVLGPLRILAIFAMLRSVGMIFAPMFKAVGRPDIEWRVRLIRLAILGPALYWGTSFGITGAAAAQVAVSALFVPVNAILISRLIGISFRDLARMVAPQLIIAGVLVGLAGLVASLQIARGFAVEPGASLAIALTISGTYVCAVLFVYRDSVATSFRLALQRPTR